MRSVEGKSKYSRHDRSVSVSVSGKFHIVIHHSFLHSADNRFLCVHAISSRAVPPCLTHRTSATPSRCTRIRFIYIPMDWSFRDLVHRDSLRYSQRLVPALQSNLIPRATKRTTRYQGTLTEWVILRISGRRDTRRRMIRTGSLQLSKIRASLTSLRPIRPGNGMAVVRLGSTKTPTRPGRSRSSTRHKIKR